MSKVADPLRERILRFEELGYDEKDPMLIQTLEACADQIDREHERRMEQQSYDLRKAFCRYIGGVVDDYKHGHKRKSWLSQQKMQLELEVLRFKATEDGGAK